MRFAQLFQPLYVQIIILSLIVAFVCGYAYYNTRELIIGPHIVLISPADGETIEGSSMVTIEGVAQRASSVTVNDREIFIDEEGAFAEPLLLSEGYTIISIKVWDKLGRMEEKKLRLTH